MNDEQSADAADSASTGDTDRRSSLDPFPAVDREAARSGADDGSTPERATRDGERASDRRTGDTGGDDDHGHACDPDSPVPCQFH